MLFLFLIFLVAVAFVFFMPVFSLVVDLGIIFSTFLAFLTVFASLCTQKVFRLTFLSIAIRVFAFFYLGLNLMITRMILANDDKELNEISGIITTFGEKFIGENYTLGVATSILILTLICFMVFTKISIALDEAPTRFVIDEMPGKQMKIDEDARIGYISEEVAKQRRGNALKEANFFGGFNESKKILKFVAAAEAILLFVNAISVYMIQNAVHGYATFIISHSLIMLSLIFLAFIATFIMMKRFTLLSVRVGFKNLISHDLVSQGVKNESK